MYDFLLSQDGDIDLSSGDLQLTEPTAQHKRDILLSAQGYYKENPEIGVDSIEFIMDNDPDNFLRTVRIQCEKDGMRVSDIQMNGDELIINAEYESD